jgi:FKBP-type peptidyl-prolyl cis-trans isomerase
MKRFIFAAALLLTTPACAQQAPDRSQEAKWQNEQQLAIASLKQSDGWQVLPGNGRWKRIKGNGAGAHPKVEDTVTLHYEGSLTDGTVFDSSYARGEPATFPLNQLIEAWQIAVPLMGVGDVIEIVVPSDIAYGPEGKGPIPGGATLKFKIELLAIPPA